MGAHHATGIALELLYPNLVGYPVGHLGDRRGCALVWQCHGGLFHAVSHYVRCFRRTGGTRGKESKVIGIKISKPELYRHLPEPGIGWFDERHAASAVLFVVAVEKFPADFGD